MRREQAFRREFERQASRSRHAYEPSGSGSGRNYILAAYILFGLGAIIQFMPIVGVILAYETEQFGQHCLCRTYRIPD